MSFSNKTAQASLKKHYPYEVVKTVNDSKLLANAASNNKKYQYKMEVTVVGNSDIRPYDPIYLDGLPNGLSGHWTVISIVHRFGGKQGYYMLELLVGTNILGQTDPDAGKFSAKRDVDSELAGQSLEVADSVLSQVSYSPNEMDLPDVDPDGEGPNVVSPDNAFPNNTPDIWAVKPPSFKQAKQNVKWFASKSSKVI